MVMPNTFGQEIRPVNSNDLERIQATGTACIN